MTDSTSPSTSTSSFVPLSLTDTLCKPQRTLHSHHTRPSLSSHHSSSSASSSGGGTGGRRPSHLPSSLSTPNGVGVGLGGANGERSSSASASASASVAERKRQKELMCESLGLVVETRTKGGKENTLNDQPSERKDMDKDERHKEQEFKSLRNQVMRLNEENRRLNERVKGLQDEVAANVRQGASWATISTASALEGVGAIQLKELEKSFAQQESLLAGYQRDAEKSFLAIEAMKKQARRYTDILAKTYGPNYETELGLDQDPNGASSLLTTTTKVLNATTGISSPAMRNQRDRVRNRMSFGGTATAVVGTPIASRAGGIEHGIVEEGEEGGDEEEGTDGPSSASASASAKEEAAVEQARHEMLRGYVEGVQTLLRSMEQRLLKRDYELELMEQRAKEEKQLAEAKVEHVENLISGIRV